MIQRRQFIKTLAAGAGGLVATGAVAQQISGCAPAPALDRGKWSPSAHRRIQAVIDQFGSRAANYNPQKRPYAVFDWDNTSIMHDTEEALFMYQINTLSFALKPEEFAQAIREGVPPGDFAADYKNADGKPVSLDAIASDLLGDYTYLWGNYQGMKGGKSIEDMRATDQFADFRAKLYFLYDAINDTHGPNVGYPWVLYLFGNMTVQQVAGLTETSNDHNLGDSIRKAKYTSPKSLAGGAGVVTASHTHGIRLTPEIASVMNTLRGNGIDVYVSTASLEDVVRVFASLPKYGYNVAPESVIGLRLEMAGNIFRPQYRRGWPLNWGPGKAEVIKRELVAKKGYGPLLVFGDSDGDYDMLRDFSDTQAGVIVNRLKKGKIGSLCKLASEQSTTANSRYVLQGRDERTGQWLPEEATLKLGSAEKRLLA